MFAAIGAAIGNFGYTERRAMEARLLARQQELQQSGCRRRCRFQWGQVPAAAAIRGARCQLLPPSVGPGASCCRHQWGQVPAAAAISGARCQLLQLSVGPGASCCRFQWGQVPAAAAIRGARCQLLPPSVGPGASCCRHQWGQVPAAAAAISGARCQLLPPSVGPGASCCSGSHLHCFCHQGSECMSQPRAPPADSAQQPASCGGD